MKLTRYFIVTCLSLMTGLPVLAQSTTKPTTASIGEMIMPSERFKNATFEQVLSAIRDLAPDFNYTIVRQSGLPTNYPLIEDLSTRKITVDQFLFLVNRIYGIKSEPVEGPSGTLWVFRIEQLGGDAGGSLVEQARQATRHVQVYRLTEIISGLELGSAEKPDQKKIINDILSLVQAAIKESGNAKDIALQVHEPTQMLMVNGTPSQLYLVSSVLSELRPSKESLDRKMQETIQAQREKLNSYTRELNDKNNVIASLTYELNEVRAKSTTRPKE